MNQLSSMNTERIKPDYRFCKLIYSFNVGAVARPEVKPKTQLAQRLREIRRCIGDPDREVFAEQVGVSKNTLASYERGETEPTVSVLDAYSKSFGINVRWVVSGEGTMFTGRNSEIDNKRLKQGTLSTEKIKPEIHSSVGEMVLELYGAPVEISACKDMLLITAKAYNRLIERADDPTDTEELKSLLPWLKRQLEKSLDKDISS